MSCGMETSSTSWILGRSQSLSSESSFSSYECSLTSLTITVIETGSGDLSVTKIGYPPGEHATAVAVLVDPELGFALLRSDVASAFV